MDATIYYYDGATGFNTPTWEGMTCVGLTTAASTPSAPIGLTASSGNGQVALNWDAPSNNHGSAIKGYDVYEGSDLLATVTSTSYNVTGLTNGVQYTFSVAAVNSAGTGTASSSVTAMPEGPISVTIMSPTSGSYTNETSVTVSWAVSSTYGLASTSVSTDGTTWTTVSGTSYTLTGLPDGSYTVHVKVTDSKGNVAFTSTTFTVDTIAPTVTSGTPDATDRSTLSTVNATFSEAMNETSVSISVTSLSGTVAGTISWNGDTAIFTPSSVLIGDTTYTVKVSGTDLAGNWLSTTGSSWTFTTANVGTISGVIKDSNGNPVGGATVTLTNTTISAEDRTVDVGIQHTYHGRRYDDHNDER